MKLLIVTQVVDKDDPALGFFHTWLAAFAEKFESILVICLKEGKHDLPENVTVYSLGKEQLHSHTHNFPSYFFTRLRYSAVFLYLIFKYRRSYDAVYVHMNQEYVLLAGIVWRLMGKYVTLWRNHFAGSLFTHLAGMLSHKVFCTSRSSYTATFTNTVFMPVGVPLDVFQPTPSVLRKEHSILWLGRVTPAKKLELLIDACTELYKQHDTFSLTICGDALPRDADYYATLKCKVQASGLAHEVEFVPGVPHAETPSLYAAHTIFVNTSPSGMFDKTMFEAMACGTLLAASSKDLTKGLPRDCIFDENEVNSLTHTLERLLCMSSHEQTNITKVQYEFVLQHSLENLATRLHEELLV